eukprot:34524-Eustigmatos_ZCMA.PRE.1
MYILHQSTDECYLRGARTLTVNLATSGGWSLIFLPFKSFTPGRGHPPLSSFLLPSMVHFGCLVAFDEV